MLVLALAFVCGQFVQLGILLLLSKRAFNISYRPLWRLLLQSLLAAIAGAVAAYVTLFFVERGVNQETFIGILMQGIAAGVMGVFAIVLAYAACDATELKEIYKSFQARLFKTDIIAPQ